MTSTPTPKCRRCNGPHSSKDCLVVPSYMTNHHPLPSSHNPSAARLKFIPSPHGRFCCPQHFHEMHGGHGHHPNTVEYPLWDGSTQSIRFDPLSPSPPSLLVSKDDFAEDEERPASVLSLSNDSIGENEEPHSRSSSVPRGPILPRARIFYTCEELLALKSRPASNDPGMVDLNAEYAKGQNTKDSKAAKLKTELCRNFMCRKTCPYGDAGKCRYAHGVHELNQPVQNNTSDFKIDEPVDFSMARAGLLQPNAIHCDFPRMKTELCWHFSSMRPCPMEGKCGFAHGEHELNTPIQWNTSSSLPSLSTEEADQHEDDGGSQGSSSPSMGSASWRLDGAPVGAGEVRNENNEMDHETRPGGLFNYLRLKSSITTRPSKND